MKLHQVVVVGALLLGGCVALPSAGLKVSAPEVSGRVVDGSTGHGLAGARVAFEGREEQYVTTKADGTFRLPAQKDLVLLKVFTPCPVYEYPTPRRFPGAVIIRMPGWEARAVLLRPFLDERWFGAKKGTPHDAPIEIGVAELTKANKAVEPSRGAVMPADPSSAWPTEDRGAGVVPAPRLTHL